jgi:hypothetical protein
VHGNWRLGSLTALNYHCLHTKKYKQQVRPKRR